VLDTIILLTGQVEHPFLASVLQGHNPQLTVRPVVTLADVAALDPQSLQRARLIAFATDVVVTPDVLDQLGYGAYNFHPGPPHFPGWRPAHFAIHHRATEFGATAHVMLERVDAGPIVGVELFGVPAGSTVGGLEELAYAQLARLFCRLAKPLATQSEPLAELPLRWSGEKTSRRSFAAMCGIPRDISTDELNRRVTKITSTG
jgi:methionyl-tRNA formyltransferase